MTTKVGLLTTDKAILRGQDRDTGRLTEALGRAGLEVDAPIWHDEAVDWLAYDLLVIRTPWDYSERYGEFMTWLNRVSPDTRILNAPELIRWNIDKQYLTDLEARGVPIIPTAFCDSLSATSAAVEDAGARDVVIKPSISAGSRDTGLFPSGDTAILHLAERIIAAGKTVLVQPAIESITTGGENALFYFNGHYSYAFHKKPILALGGGYVGGDRRPQISRANPSSDEISLGQLVIDSISHIAAQRSFAEDAMLPLYARVDMSSEMGVRPQVLEVEVFEPAYFIDIAPEAVEIFVRSVKDRLRV